MTKYMVSTGLASIDARDFDSRREAWDTLACELMEAYGLKKAEPRASIVGRLHEKQRVPLRESHGREDDCTQYVHVMAGYISKDWDGQYFFEGPSESAYPYENHE